MWGPSLGLLKLSQWLGLPVQVKARRLVHLSFQPELLEGGRSGKALRRNPFSVAFNDAVTSSCCPP